MTDYKTIEKSIDQRRPVRLYQFSRDATSWCYCSGDQAFNDNGLIYESLKGGIYDQGIVYSDGSNSDNVQIYAPANIAIADLFRVFAPSSQVNLTIFNAHLGTTEAVPCWYGAIGTVNFSAIDRVCITCSPLESLTRKPGATQTYSRQCETYLYSKQCKVIASQYKVKGTISAVTSTTIEVAEAAQYADGWFTGGYLTFITDKGFEDMKAIEQHNGTTLTVWGGAIGLTNTMTINFYPGCDQSQATCHNKFNNILNRQACDHLQGKSIFDGNPVGW